MRIRAPYLPDNAPFSAAQQAWLNGYFAALAASPERVGASAMRQPVGGDGHSVAAEPAPAPERPRPGRSPGQPYSTRLLTNRRLNAKGSNKDTRHIEISLEGSGLTYEVGDALGIVPTNCPLLVKEMLDALGFSGEEEVPAPGDVMHSIRDALTSCYEITRPARPLLEAFALHVDEAHLRKLLEPDRRKELDAYLRGREIIDFVRMYPHVRWTPENFVDGLRKLKHRLYSISSSPLARPLEVHITVGVVRYESHDRTRKGVCSTFLADRVGGETPLPVFIHSNKNFGLPEDASAPVIMVGPGTGIAPFRAFLEERRAAGAPGRNWLFFGDQKKQTDFLYRDELEAMLGDGTLTRLDTAFSRDQKEKIYVQDRMAEHTEALYAWLEEGAYFYVCGDASRMAKDVDAALHQIIEKAGGLTSEESAAYVQRLKKEKRYQRDVY